MKDNSQEKKLLDEETTKKLGEILNVRHTAMIFKTQKAAEQKIYSDFLEIQHGKGKAVFNKKFNWIQFGLKPINTLWYMSEDNCIDKLNSTKFHKILFMDFEANEELKQFAKSRMSLKSGVVMTKDRIKNGII